MAKKKRKRVRKVWAVKYPDGTYSLRLWDRKREAETAFDRDRSTDTVVRGKFVEDG